jgi:hypothetical protein
MSTLTRRLLIGFLVAATLGLGACSNEPKERTAFMQFLQTRILDKKGVHLPQLNQEERKGFGAYAAHYDLMTSFHSSMDKEVLKKMEEITTRGKVNTLQEAIKRRDDLVAVRDSVPALVATISEARSKADAARAALKQPDDLKAVYDQAYARNVVTPAETLQELLPHTKAQLDSVMKVLDFVQQHPQQVTLTGSTAEVQDPALLKQLNVLMEEMNSKTMQVMENQRKINSVIYGR